jgi:hypothetical protein
VGLIIECPNGWSLGPRGTPRAALLAEVRRRRRSKEIAAEVASLEADAKDRKELLAVAELMEALRASG